LVALNAANVRVIFVSNATLPQAMMYPPWEFIGIAGLNAR